MRIMEITTNTIKIGSTTYLRIPSAMVKYFQLEEQQRVTIEDLDTNKAKIRF